MLHLHRLIEIIMYSYSIENMKLTWERATMKIFYLIYKVCRLKPAEKLSGVVYVENRLWIVWLL